MKIRAGDRRASNEPAPTTEPNVPEELDALGKIIAALTPLSPEGRRRVIRTACVFFKLPLETP